MQYVGRRGSDNSSGASRPLRTISSGRCLLDVNTERERLLASHEYLRIWSSRNGKKNAWPYAAKGNNVVISSCSACLESIAIDKAQVFTNAACLKIDNSIYQVLSLWLTILTSSLGVHSIHELH